MVKILISVTQEVMKKRLKLNAACRETIKQGDAEGTRLNRETHERAYKRFCNEYQFKPFPADNWRYCQFAQHLYEQKKVPATCDNYVSSVRTVHKLKGYAVPEVGQIHYKKLSDGLKRQNEKPVKQAEPMTHGKLRKLFKQVDFAKELEAVAWVAVLLAFNLILRVSNIGPKTRKKFDIGKHFLRSDIALKRNYWTMSVRWAKNIQFKNRILHAPLIPAKTRDICPVYWVGKMLRNVPAQSHEPFFTVHEKNSRYPLTSSQVARLLRKWCIKAGIDEKTHTTHALRRGGLCWAHDAKLSGETLKILGGWASMAYQRYLDHDLQSRIESGKKMAEIVRN